MCKIYDFNNALAFEQKRWPVADKFLNQLYPKSIIKRQDWNTQTGRRNQQVDIDVIVGDVKISEKFRDKSAEKFKDIIIELYSNVETKNPGYTLKSMADYLHYWKGTNVYIFKDEQLKNAANTCFKIFEDTINEMLKNIYPKSKKDSKEGYSTDLRIWLNEKEKDGNTWFTFTATVPLTKLDYDKYEMNSKGVWVRTHHGLNIQKTPSLFDF